MAVQTTIQLRRGLNSAIPTSGLATGEPLFVTDTKRFHIAYDANNTVSFYNKDDIDSLLQGLAWKQPVKAATTASITLTGEQTIDTVSCVTGDRVLVKDQSGGADAYNGVYIVSTGAWTRASDMNAGSEFPAAAMIVLDGDVNIDMGFVCTNKTAPTLGSTLITFTQFTGAGQLSAGVAIRKTSGNLINLDMTKPLTANRADVSDGYYILVNDGLTMEGTKIITRANFLTNLVAVDAAGVATPGYLSAKIVDDTNGGLSFRVDSDTVKVKMDISNLASQGATAVDAAADLVAMYDNSLTSNTKVSVNDLIKYATVDGGSF